MQPRPLPLLCFPHAGGGAAFFRAWPRRLGPGVAVRPIVPPGREARRREPLCTSLDALVAALMPQLRSHIDGPFAVFGHSLGALVAYDVCRRLEQRPVCLLVSGRRAPHLPARLPPLHRLPRAEFLARIERLNGIPREVLADRDLVDAVLPALRADFQVSETYVAGRATRLAVPIVAMAGAADPLVTPREMLAWRSVTTAAFAVRVFAGDHFYLRDAAPEPLAAVRSELERAQNCAPGAGTRA